MKIIAVNINKALSEGKNTIIATQRAWLLNQARCENFDFVIGVSTGRIRGYYVLNDVLIDLIDNNRVCFNLTSCNNEEKLRIDNFIKRRNTNLRYFVTKFIE